MSNFSSKTKYVEARPRREKKLGRGGSVVSVAASSGGGGVSKSYVDSNFVTLATEQTIPGAKDFVGGIKVNGLPITKSASANNTIYLDANLAVSGAITMFGSGSTTFPTIWANIPFNPEHMSWDGSQWNIAGGGGTGGGISAAEVNILISNALKPYALSTSIPTDNKQLSNGAGYATVSDLDTRINNLINGAPAAYDTLKEIADVLAGNVNSIGDILTALDTKATKTYVEAELEKYVKLATAQSIEAQHNFVNGLQIGGLPITKSASANNTIYLDANLVVSGAITMFGSGSTTFPTIWANIPFNPEHMSWDGSQWNITGGGGSGSLDTNAVNALIYDYLTHNSYATISDISSALVGYATQSWVASQGYITQSALSPYFLISSFTKANIKSTLGISDWALAATKPSYTAAEVGAVVYSEDIAIGNHSSYSHIGYGYRSGGWISDGPAMAFGANANYNHQLQFSNDSSSTIYHRTIAAGAQGEWAIIIDSNNIGSYNAGSADVLKKSFAHENINYDAGDGLKLIYCYGNPGNFASDYQSGISVLTDYTGWQLTSYGGVNIPNPYFRQRDDAGIWRDWHQLAFLTDNVASATKLATPRTIWGQSFDGSGDVSGDAKIGAIYLERSNEINVYGSDTTLYLNYASSGNVAMCIGGGNVTIGGTTVSEKFNVQGNVLIKGGDNPYLLIKDHQDRNWYIQYYKDYISLGAGFANSVKIDSIGNLIAPGAITMFSQLSMKDIINRDGLDLEQLAMIQPARFTWKDGRDNRIHIGGIADEVMRVLPEVVHRTKDDKLTMDYGSAGFFMAASLIKPVIDHEQRLQSAEKEIKGLRAENKRLREQLRIA